MTASEIKTRIDSLENIIANYNPTVKSYSLDGESVTYNSIEEIYKALECLRRLYRMKCGAPPCVGMPVCVPISATR